MITKFLGLELSNIVNDDEIKVGVNGTIDRAREKVSEVDEGVLKQVVNKGSQE